MVGQQATGPWRAGQSGSPEHPIPRHRATDLPTRMGKRVSRIRPSHSSTWLSRRRTLVDASIPLVDRGRSGNSNPRARCPANGFQDRSGRVSLRGATSSVPSDEGFRVSAIPRQLPRFPANTDPMRTHFPFSSEVSDLVLEPAESQVRFPSGHAQVRIADGASLPRNRSAGGVLVGRPRTR
jgi:hypothetical protein